MQNFNLDTMNPTSNRNLRNYFHLQQSALRLVGVSLRETDALSYKLYSALCISLVVTYTMQESYGLFVFSDNIDRLSNVISLATSHILGIAKVFVLLKNKSSFMRIQNTLETGIFVPNFHRGGGLEEELISKCVTYTTKQSWAYWIFAIAVIFFGMLSSLLTKIKSANHKDWETPMIPFALFEIKTTSTFVIIYCYQSLSISVFALIISAIDLSIVSVIAHIKTQFTILKNIIRNINNDAVPSEKGAKHVQTQRLYLQEKLEYAVKYHQSILDLAHNFENYFSFLVLTVFVANSIVLCFTMYHASMYPLSSAKALGDFCYVIAVCIQVLLFCYWGNEVTLESQSLAFVCYEIDFLGLSTSFQRQVVFMMQRCQKPVILTAGKFINLSLTAYVSILRMSYSYYMVLRRRRT